MSKSKKAQVWASRAYMDSTRVKGFTADPLPSGVTPGELAKRNEAGEAMPEEYFPAEVFAEYPDKWEKKQPDLIFLAAGPLVVSSACADILRKFDLGQSSLYPVRLFQHNRTTPVEGDYFCLNIGERKDAFLPEQTPRVKILGNEQMKMRPNLLDDEIAVSSVALEGPDLWANPPLTRVFFLSDRLTQALRAAKMSRVFGFRTCRVVDTG
jgi:hypothetical protein